MRKWLFAAAALALLSGDASAQEKWSAVAIAGVGKAYGYAPVKETKAEAEDLALGICKRSAKNPHSCTVQSSKEGMAVLTCWIKGNLDWIKVVSDKNQLAAARRAIDEAGQDCKGAFRLNW